MNLKDKVTIGIATKDRPDILQKTLSKLIKFGIAECNVIVCDDGSQNRLDISTIGFVKNVILIRNEQPQGQAIARNQIINSCTTPFLLQLDDDSYPVAGDLSGLVQELSRMESTVAIAIPFEEPKRERSFPEGLPKHRAVPVKAFVGCAVLLNRKTFKELGGYADWIFGTCEEEEFCIRAHQAGIAIFTIDQLRIRHDVTSVARNLVAIQRRSVSNWTRVYVRSAPLYFLLFALIKLSIQSIMYSVKSRQMSPLLGYLQALFDCCSWSARQPMQSDSFKAWRHLPHILDYYD